VRVRACVCVYVKYTLQVDNVRKCSQSHKKNVDKNAGYGSDDDDDEAKVTSDSHGRYEPVTSLQPPRGCLRPTFSRTPPTPHP